MAKWPGYYTSGKSGGTYQVEPPTSIEEMTKKAVEERAKWAERDKANAIPPYVPPPQVGLKPGEVYGPPNPYAGRAPKKR